MIFNHHRDKSSMKKQDNVGTASCTTGKSGGSPTNTSTTTCSCTTLGPGRDTTMLDYSNTSHIKTYYKTIAPLETKYNSKSSSLHIFMNSILNRAKNFRWCSILNIDDSGRTTRNVLNEYGQLTAEEVKNHAQTNWSNQPMRDTQNLEMMYHFY